MTSWHVTSLRKLRNSPSPAREDRPRERDPLASAAGPVLARTASGMLDPDLVAARAAGEVPVTAGPAATGGFPHTKVREKIGKIRGKICGLRFAEIGTLFVCNGWNAMQCNGWKFIGSKKIEIEIWGRIRIALRLN